ncbi:MAG: cytochrome c oxidase accessory protein CcoG [Puniceicoccaceae bacterium]|nr:MAG: cytochrome c oxidase accessory protein CcoG [Puniceicoccaceae bacterium]
MAAPGRLQPNRDSVTTIRDDGSRLILHPADVRGRYTLWRRLTAVVLIAVYALLPWIPVGGAPAVFFDVRQLQLHFFGLTLAPQDFWLGFFLITGLGFTLFYITALLGRVWCGWACPQTVFLEHVFRRVERWIEGDATARRRLDEAPWTARKAALRTLKHGCFILLSAVIAHVFLAYFVSLPEVWQMITHSPLEHWGTFVFMVVASGILYFNFAWFREQLCIIICPYGRLQSALVDDDSMVIGYDEGRGEPRGKLNTPGAGDCIDCFRCVQVCPTGIDIRQGLQLECIGCANCIDACDEIMDRVGRPRGLVRYDSQNGLAGRVRKIFRPRLAIYTLLLCAGAAALVASLSTLQPATVNAIRMPGGPYYVDTDQVRNQFLLRVTNKRREPLALEITVEAAATGIALDGATRRFEVPPLDEVRQPVVVTVPRSEYAGPFRMTLRVRSAEAGVDLSTNVQFLGPDPRLFHGHD